MSEEIISIENLNINYISNSNKIRALENINFRLFKNEILGIVGESGSGKTTLARYLLNILDKEETEIFIDKYLINNIRIDLFPDNIKELRGCFISMVMQNPVSTLNSTMNIGNHFRLVLNDVFNIRDKQQQNNLIQKVLESVSLQNHGDILKKYPMELSAGMNQRINIALSIINNPKVLIMDEPTSSIDEESREKILSIINNFVQNDNMSVILITHDILSAKKTCDRVLVMKNGEIIDNFYSDQKVFHNKYTEQLYKSALLKRDQNEVTKDGETLIQLNKICKRFGHNEVLNNFSMYLKRGEILGIIGKSGIGKTTVSKLIMGIYRPSSGFIKIKELLRIEMVFQNANLSLNHNQKIFKILNEENYINKKQEYSKDFIRSFLKDFNLSEDILEKYVVELSEGQKQIISIVRSLLSNPDIIILDEPTSSLDAVSQKKILDLLIKVKKKYNLTYILISHDRQVIKYMCSRCIRL